MALSSVTYTGNGTTTSFAIPFPYLFQSDVSATVNGVTTAFTWTNPALVHFATAPINGSAVFIIRKTNITTLDVVFTDGSTVQASDINTAELQSLYLAQEANDGVSVAIAAAATATAATGAANAAAAAANAAVAGLVPFTGDSGAGGVRGLVPAPPTGSFAAGKFLSAGGSFLAPPTASSVGTNVVTAGADPTGVVDASSVFQSVFTAIGATGGVIIIPPGRYKIATAISQTIAAGKSVSIFGYGQDVTTIFTPTGTIFGITLGDAVSSSFHIRDLTLTTQAVNVGQAIILTAARAGIQEMDTQNDITNITIRGDDTVSILSPFHTNYFANGIVVQNGVSNINFYGLLMPGSGAVAGNGVLLSGDPTNALFGIVYNFVNCSFWFMANCITYGTYIQGVAVSNCNFTGANVGIIIPTGVVGTFQLAVSNSQMNCGAACIDAVGNMTTMSLTNNLITLQKTTTGQAVTGIFGLSTIVGNVFTGQGTANGNGIVLAGTSTGVVVTGNVFQNMTTGVNVQSGATNVNVQSNLYVTVTLPTSPTTTTGTVKIGGGSA